MFAIIETGGKQYRVRPGDTLDVERVAGESGGSIDLGRVLMVGSDDRSVKVGTPTVEGAVVRAEVVGAKKGEKIIVYRFKSKVRYRRKTGHRQQLTRVRITDISLDGGSSSTAARTPEAAEPSTEPAAESTEA